MAVASRRCNLAAPRWRPHAFANDQALAGCQRENEI
jgi:hypothetical protein